MNFIKKLIFSFLLLFIYTQAFAQIDIKITSQEKKIDINNSFVVDINFSGKDLKSVNISNNIKGLENFDILNTWKSSTMTYMNGVSNSQLNIKYVLQARKIGNYEIGPIEASDDGKKVLSNTIKFEVSGDKKTKQDLVNISPKIDYIKEFDTQQKSEKSYVYFFIILFLCLVLVIALLLKLKNNLDNEEIISLNISDEKTIYPNINDEKFIENLEIIFRNKLSNYKIENINKKTFTQISKEIEISQNKKEIFDLIIETINKSKYGNIIVDKTNLIEYIKEF